MSLYKDLIDSNYCYSSEEMDILSLEEFSSRKYSLLWGLKRYCYHFIRSFRTIKYLPTLFKVRKTDGLIMINSLNQYNSVLPLLNSKDMDTKAISIDWKGPDNVLKYPIILSYLLSIFFIPQTLYFYFTCKDAYIKKSFHYGFNEYCLTFSYRFVNNIWLFFCKPRFIMIISDHQMVTRDIVKSGKWNGIKTIYMQHASVTEKFPKLIMDYAFLEGNDAKDKYLQISGGNTKTIIELIGMLKLDGIINSSGQELSIKTVGLCTNEFDDLVIADQLIGLLKGSFEVLLRPHPRDGRYFEWKEMASKRNILFSESKTQNPAEFLKEVNCVVSYNCSIIIESLILNKPTFSFQLGQKDFDHYGFLAHNIVEHFTDGQSLLNEISNIRVIPNSINWKKKIKYYCDTIDTAFEGKTQELMVKLFVKYNI